MPNTPTPDEMTALCDYMAAWVFLIAFLAACVAASGAWDVLAGTVRSRQPNTKEDDKPNDEQE